MTEKKMDFLEWAANQYEIDHQDLNNLSANPIIHFEKKGKYVQGIYNGYPVYREKYYEDKMNEMETWICKLKFTSTDKAKCYFATPIKKIDADFFFELNLRNKSMIADYLWDYYKDDIAFEVGQCVTKVASSDSETAERNKQLEAKVKELTESLKKAEDENKTLKEGDKGITETVSMLAKECEDAKEKLSKAEKELATASESLKSSNTRYSTDMGVATEKIARLTEENEKLKKGQQAIEQARLKRESEEKTASIENKNLKARLKALDNTIEDMNRQIADLHDNHAQDLNTIKQLKKDLNEANERAKESSLKTPAVPQNIGFSKIIEAYTEQIEVFEKENNELKEKNAGLDAMVSELQSSLEVAKKKSAAAEEIGTLKEQVQHLTKLNNELKDANAALMENTVAVPKTITKFTRISADTMSSEWFKDGRYSVYYNESAKAIKIVPSDAGRIVANKGSARLSGIDAVFPFRGQKDYTARQDKDGGMIIVVA